MSIDKKITLINESKISTPPKKKVERILYNNDEFSIISGIWEKDNRVIAMRWNGDDSNSEDLGYPKAYGNPVWFIIPDQLTIPILKVY